MAQFDVYRNPETAQSRRIPFLLDVQSALLAALNTTIIVPLYDPAAVNAPPIHGLMPTFEIEGQPVVMMAPELAGVPRKKLPQKTSNLTEQRDVIIAALGLVLTGV